MYLAGHSSRTVPAAALSGSDGCRPCTFLSQQQVWPYQHLYCCSKTAAPSAIPRSLHVQQLRLLSCIPLAQPLSTHSHPHTRTW